MPRKLVESDEVLLVFQSLGTPTNNAIRPYMNMKKVPQLFVATGATQFGERKSFRGLWAGSRPIRPRGVSWRF
jgi:branched-chain amino acid transport system substrate-binding protein